MFQPTLLLSPLLRLVRHIGVLLFLLSGQIGYALEATPVAPGVYAFLGSNTESGPTNGGFVANSGFIVGPTGVIVIDTGASYVHGRQMLEAIAHVTSQPVVMVILTHAVQDFVFGAEAFAERGIPLLTHSKTVVLMQARCEHCLEGLRKSLGDQAMAHTRLVIPEKTIDASTTLELAGRTIDLLHLDWASTPGDLAVMDRVSGVLFAGGIVIARRVPELRDGDFDGWLRALASIARLGGRHIVPGYGPIQSSEEILQTRDYLLALDQTMRALYERGLGLMQALDSADLPAYESWALYPDQHRRNALRRYLQLEVEDLEK